MARGPRKHLKRLYAPKHWMLAKLGGHFAPRPSSGPHKVRECLPLVVFLRNRLKYALTNAEAKSICMQRLVKVDHKVRTDPTFPAGLMDVVSIAKTGENFRFIYDVKGRFNVHRIQPLEAEYKLCRIEKKWMANNAVPMISTHDGRVIRYPDPEINAHDTVKVNLKTGLIDGHVVFEPGNICMAIGGSNVGRIGILMDREKHDGDHDIVHVKDARNHVFTTRLRNVFIIGKGDDPWISLPKGKGIRLTIAEERDAKRGAVAAA